MKILIYRNGSIGNTVLATAFIRSLKTIWPDSIVDVVVDDWGMDLLAGNPLIRKLYCYRRQQDGPVVQYRLVRQWIREKYDYSFHLRSGTRNELLAWLSRIPHRIGFNLKGSLQLLTERKERQPQIHVRDMDLLLLKGLAPQQPIPAFLPDLYPDPQSLADLELKLVRMGIASPCHQTGVSPQTGTVIQDDVSILQNGMVLPIESRPLNNVITVIEQNFCRYVVIHPTGKTVSGRGWNLEFWREMARRLKKYYRLSVVVITSPQDVKRLSKIFDFLSPQHLILESKISELMALIHQASFFMGNDSGPAHIAEAFDIPKLVVYPDDQDNFDRWSPLRTEKCLVIRQAGLSDPGVWDSVQEFMTRMLPSGVPVFHGIV